MATPRSKQQTNDLLFTQPNQAIAPTEMNRLKSSQDSMCRS
ncbi:hypothetical protein [Oculatella sp. FACHB-28]|nr:hypothetical protein [Oculatella sp. FACHB-28]